MAQRVIGVDVGGTKISVAVLEDGRLSDPELHPTELSSTDALLDQLTAAIAAAGPADAVGLGIPSVVDVATGTARSSVNIPLQGVPLRDLLGERVGVPVIVDNDASVAALAEAYDDDLRLVAESVVMVTVGTGVGGGIVLGGRIHHGATGAAAEIGHMIVAAGLAHGAPPAPARFPAAESLEHHAAGRTLDALGRKHGFEDGPAVVTAAQRGDATARDCLRVVGERLGVGIANLVNVLEPELLLVGGGVSHAGELLLEPARSAAARFILPGVGTRTRIELARYGPRAGVRGAALLALFEREARRGDSPQDPYRQGVEMATQQVNARLAALTAAGTSVWLDQIARGLIDGGELQRLVDEYSLRGLTSNPTIFNQAILGSEDYDEPLERLVRDGAQTRAIYQALAIRDIQDAADILRPVYDASEGADGFVSLEVDPDIAFDTDRTMQQAREYHERVDRPNLMIKIPGTDEGVPAIEQMIYEGRNINVTLLFAVEQYAKVADAYIRGLERRHAEGRSLDVASVASFFVSRVDAEVDKRLADLDREDLRGRAGLANARAAYGRFQEIFDGERFAALREAGARVQRPLWASTGVKDPAYPDTLYVDGLVAPETVNTMPMTTLLAAADHAEVPADSAAIDPEPDLRALADAGVDLDDVTDQLLREGVDKFVEPMEKLLDGIDAKREAIITHRPATIEASIPDALEARIAARVEQAAREDVARRIWQCDATLWGEAGQAEIADRLGWLTVTDVMEQQAGELRAFAQEVRDAGVTDVVLLGMGGSSLAPLVIRSAFGRQEGWPELHVLDSTDAGAIRAMQGAIDLERALFVVSTKSGGTIETISLFRHFWEQRPDGSAFVAITDPGSEVEAMARDHGFRRTFLNDPEIGGRYSALSLFGLVPAALMGVDVARLLDGAGVAAHTCQSFDSGDDSSGLWLGVTWAELALAGRDKLTYVIDPPLEAFGLWIEQLLAESTGKLGRGIVPVVGEPLGEPGAYRADRVFLRLRDEDRPSEAVDAAMGALVDAGQAVIVRRTQGPEDLGRLFFFAEFAVAAAGWALGINPFDQPDVQEAKDRTRAVLDADSPDQPDAGDDELRALLAGLRDDDGGGGGGGGRPYLAIVAYAAPSARLDEAIAHLRATIRDATGAATTFGYGPRYLHSTGQLHKGGPATVSVLALAHDSEPDLPVPRAGYTFNRLKHAQLTGDVQTLRERGRTAERVTLPGADAAVAVRSLTERLQALL